MKTKNSGRMAKKPFRNKMAQAYYEKKAKNSDVYEYGVDTHGKIYFAWLNGNVERYTRTQFIAEAKAAAEYEYEVAEYEAELERNY